MNTHAPLDYHLYGTTPVEGKHVN